MCVYVLYLYFLGLRIYRARAPRSPAEGTACGAATAAGGPRSPPIPVELGGTMGGSWFYSGLIWIKMDSYGLIWINMD